jgi:1-acyl-sn-glycerol-3-phosphate acyltransferase
MKSTSDDTDNRPESRWSIRFWRSVVVLFARLYHHLKVRTRNPLPASGAAILVCNHISPLDPFLLQAASSRLIVWMMAKEYYDLKSMQWFFKIVEAIPVNRGARDSSSTRAAIRALEKGRVLGIFPEGKIETKQELLPFHIGVALIALKTGVPVYPAYIEGTSRGKDMVPAMIHPNRVSIRFGPKVAFDASETTKEGLAHATQAIEKAVESLRQQELALDGRKFPTV